MRAEANGGAASGGVPGGITPLVVGLLIKMGGCQVFAQGRGAKYTATLGVYRLFAGFPPEPVSDDLLSFLNQARKWFKSPHQFGIFIHRNFPTGSGDLFATAVVCNLSNKITTLSGVEP